MSVLEFPAHSGEVCNACGFCGSTFPVFEQVIMCAENMTCPHMFHKECVEYQTSTICRICKTGETNLKFKLCDPQNVNKSLMAEGRLWGFRLFQYYSAIFSFPRSGIGCPIDWLDFIENGPDLPLETVRIALINRAHNSNLPIDKETIRFYVKIWYNPQSAQFECFNITQKQFQLQNVLKYSLEIAGKNPNVNKSGLINYLSNFAQEYQSNNSIILSLADQVIPF